MNFYTVIKVSTRLDSITDAQSCSHEDSGSESERQVGLRSCRPFFHRQFLYLNRGREEDFSIQPLQKLS